MCLCCRRSGAVSITGFAHPASLSSPPPWSSFSPRSEPGRERSSPAALSLAHLSWEGGNRKTCQCLFLFNSQNELLLQFLIERASEKETNAVFRTMRWCVKPRIPGSLFLQGFCRFGSLVDHLLCTVLLHVSLIRRHLWLQRLLGLLITMVPAGATLRAECANQQRLADTADK